MLVSGIGAEIDACLLCSVLKKGAEGEVDLSIHQNDVGLMFEGSQTIVCGGTDGVGAFD